MPVTADKIKHAAGDRLRVAAIVGDRLYRGLSVEYDMVLVVPETWRFVFKYAKPDFLLVESTWCAVSGHWYMAQSVSGENHQELLQIVKKAGQYHIPTVFWMTWDSEYYPHFSKFAEIFDFVFCADPDAVILFQKDGIDAKLLLPAVQAAVFNPIRRDEDEGFNSKVLYDGLVDLFKYPEIGSHLKPLIPYGINICQTGQVLYKSQKKRFDASLIPHLKGSVHEAAWPSVLKHALVYLSVEKGLKAVTSKEWAWLEAAASRVPIAYLNDKRRHAPFDCIGQVFEDEGGVCEYVRAAKAFDLAIEKDCHLAWREVALNHIFACRMKTISKAAGVEYQWEPYPKVSIVTGTMRKTSLRKCIDQYMAQSYPNKELILVYNGQRQHIEGIIEQYGNRKDIHITAIHREAGVGTVLNHGLFKSSGHCFFRMDDDDLYGPNYIMDIMLHRRSKEADIFGKRASFFRFEGDDDIYLRDQTMPSIKTFKGKKLHADQEHMISGCSFGASVAFLKKQHFSDVVQASVDSELIETIKAEAPETTCLLTDNLNLVVHRSKDVSKHTWRMDAQTFKKNSKKVAGTDGELIC